MVTACILEGELAGAIQKVHASRSSTFQAMAVIFSIAVVGIDDYVHGKSRTTTRFDQRGRHG